MSRPVFNYVFQFGASSHKNTAKKKLTQVNKSRTTTEKKSHFFHQRLKETKNFFTLQLSAVVILEWKLSEYYNNYHSLGFCIKSAHVHCS